MKNTDIGHQVMVVEDEPLLALMLGDLLLDLGHRVLHAGSLPDALALAERERFDAAILDVNLDGEDVFPLAARLRELKTPFVFATAGNLACILPEFRSDPLIAKPYTIDQVQVSLERLFAPH